MNKVKEKAVEEMIGKYLNYYGWSDVHPMGKIIGVRKSSILVLAHVSAVRDENVKMEYIPGGFAGHCVNNHQQKWIFTVDESQTTEVRLSAKLLKNHKIENFPNSFYDYNF